MMTLSFMALILPAEQIFAGTFAPRWVTINVSPITQVSYPLDNWRLLGRMHDESSSSPGGDDMQMIQGERWVTLGDEAAGELGLKSNQIASMFHAFPANGAMVFARYNPGSSLLRIDVLKVEKHPDGDIYTYVCQYTPWHGNADAADRAFMTPAEKTDFYRAGHNPFTAFEGKDATDPDFHNVNFSAVQVAVGSAMRHYNATLGMIAVFTPRLDETRSTSGGWFRKTVTITVKGYTYPKWFIATPVELQPTGTSSNICVVNNENPCAPQHIDPSGVSVRHWTGGNLPMNEDLLYTWNQSQSGWTILSFALVFAAVFTVGWGVGLSSLFTGSSVVAYGSATATSLTSLTSAFIASGTTYAVGSMIGQAQSVRNAQNGFFGRVDTGFLPPSPPASAQAAGLDSAMNNEIDSGMDHSMSAVTFLFKGNCPDGWTDQQCWTSDLDPGHIPRPDSYIQFNTTKWMRQTGAPQAAGVMSDLPSEGIYLPSAP